MAYLPEDRALGAPPVTPRVSTPEPLDVPRWEDTLDFVPGTFEETQTVPEIPKLSLGLADLTLGLKPLQSSVPKVDEWKYAYQPQPTYNPGSVAGSGGKPYSGGLGPGAYGWTGTTGLKGTRGSAPYGFQRQMWSALQAANAAMKAAGLGTFSITDGYRSYDAQVATKKKKGKWAATPGRSVHGLGLAADLGLTNAQYKWLLKNGKRFGLVNLPSESWHWQLDPKMWQGWS